MAEIKVLIAQAEAACAGYQREIEHLETNGRDNRVARARLRMAEGQVEQLQRSRQMLVESDEGMEEHEEGARGNESLR